MPLERKNLSPDNTSSPSTRRWPLWLLIILIAGAACFRIGYVSGHQGLSFQPTSFKIINQKDQTATVDYSLLWNAIGVVNQNYIDKQNIDQQKVLYGAVRGAVASAGDQYTEFFDPEDLKSFQTELKGSFEGIGAEVSTKDGNIVIVAALPDTPAQKAGLLANDIIVKIDGQSTAGMSVDNAVSKIRGQKGTEVTLSIYRSGHNTPFDVKITRDTIAVKSVTWKYQDVKSKHLAVITLSRFGDDTNELFDQAVKDITAQKQPVAAIILDLRDDPGGYLESAVHVASYWVPKGKVVVTEAHSDGSSIPYNSDGFGQFTPIKTEVLINGGSASAAEILAGALHDYSLGKLIGEKSFGKGSVQELINLPQNTAVKVTVAKWITPNGKNLNKDGLDPDVPVKRTEDDIKNQKDTQLDAALTEISQ